MIEYFDLGEVVEPLQEDELYPETVALLKACHACSFVDVVEVRSELVGQGRTEYIVIDAADGTIDSENPGQIRREERLAIGVNHQYRVPILVYALRKDFPALSHQHSNLPGSPKVLCLYNATWAAVQRGWTPQRFLAQMFWWLRESAQLKLHRADQPLEQLFYMSPYQLILPSDYTDYAKPGGHPLTIMDISSGPRADPFEPILLKAIPATASHDAQPVRLVSIVVPAVDSTTVVGIPDSLGTLHDQLVVWGSDLYEPLHSAIFDAIPGGVKPAAEKEEAILIMLWAEYVERHGDKAYRYSQYCHHYRLWRGRQRRSMRQVHRAGEKIFIDYCGPTVPVVDRSTGEVRKAQVFVAVLGASSYTFAETTWSQSLPDWIASHQRMFRFFGGVPELLVPDNLKAAVTKADRYSPTINETYAELACHYQTAVLPARPYKPKDKAKAETSVLLVERWILARLRHQMFFSLAELNAAIAALLPALNQRLFQGRTESELIHVAPPMLSSHLRQAARYAEHPVRRPPCPKC
jgi:transposase